MLRKEESDQSRGKLYMLDRYLVFGESFKKYIKSCETERAGLFAVVI